MRAFPCNNTHHLAFTELPSTPLALIMQFIQCIITAFALFGISAYASPVHPERIAEVPRKAVVYCGGYGRLTCNTHCVQSGKKHGTCTARYVNTSMVQI